MDQLRRRLPRVWAEGKRLFVTWHLHGSLPHALYPPPNQQNAGQAFVWMDHYLDSSSGGPRYLKQQNHVHLLVLPRVSPSRFLQTLKGYTAREANRLLGRTDRIEGYIENNPVKAGLVANAEDYPGRARQEKPR